MHVTHSPKRVVVAFDGSAASRRALDLGSRLARSGSSLTVVHVRRNGADACAGELASVGLPIHHVSASQLEFSGSVADEIVTAATALAADLIIVGREAISTSVLGSVSAAVVDRAACNVLVAS